MVGKGVGRLGVRVACAAILASAASQVRAEGVRTITSWDLQTRPLAVKAIRNAADRFEKAHPGYRVEDTHVLNEAYKTKLKIALGAKDPPCLFTTWGGGPLREYVKAGQVVDLTPALERDPAFRDRFLPNSFAATTHEGRVYGIPAENTALAVIFYNKALFAEHGITPPRTFDDMMAVIETLKAKGIAPFALANKSKWPGLMFYGYLVDRIGGPEVFARAVQRREGGSFTDPAFVRAGAVLQDLVRAGAFQKGFNGLDWDIGGARRLLYSGKAAMELMGNWEASNIAGENPAFAKSLGSFPFPAVPGGKGDPGNLLGTLGDNFVSVTTACPEREAAIALAKTLTDDASAADRLADRRAMPLKGLKIDDPLLAEMMDLAAKAPSLQLWWDQEMPPSLGEKVKDIVQALLGLSITPEDAARQLEAAAKATP
ncbi:extracellular solute-binding protein [Methylobacterium sp. JK268]